MFSQIEDQLEQKTSGRSLEELLGVISPSLLHMRFFFCFWITLVPVTHSPFSEQYSQWVLLSSTFGAEHFLDKFLGSTGWSDDIRAAQVVALFCLPAELSSWQLGAQTSKSTNQPKSTDHRAAWRHPNIVQHQQKVDQNDIFGLWAISL